MTGARTLVVLRLDAQLLEGVLHGDDEIAQNRASRHRPACAAGQLKTLRVDDRGDDSSEAWHAHAAVLDRLEGLLLRAVPRGVVLLAARPAFSVRNGDGGMWTPHSVVLLAAVGTFV